MFVVCSAQSRLINHPPTHTKKLITLPSTGSVNHPLCQSKAINLTTVYVLKHTVDVFKT